jgi:hypothetical protein
MNYWKDVAQEGMFLLSTALQMLLVVSKKAR